MALLFCDGMDAYSATADAANKWTSIGAAAYVAAGGRFGGGALQLTTASGTFSQQIFTYAAGYTLNIAKWVKLSGITAGVGSYAGFLGLYGVYAMLAPDASGHLNFYPVGSASPNPTHGSINVCDNNWHWVEIQVVLNTAATGSVQVYVDGVLDINITGIATCGHAPDGYVYFGDAGISGAITFTRDDIIIWDNTGATFNTFPLGPQRISTQNPSGAGASTQFTPSSGSNYACVAQAYSGTAYVSDASSGHTDLYAVPGLGYTPAAISAVVLNTFAQNPANDGSRVLKPTQRSGATPTTVQASGITLTGSNVNRQTPFFVDGASAAWAAATVNAMQIGIGD